MASKPLMGRPKNDKFKIDQFHIDYVKQIHENLIEKDPRLPKKVKGLFGHDCDIILSKFKELNRRSNVYLGERVFITFKVSKYFAKNNFLLIEDRLKELCEVFEVNFISAGDFIRQSHEKLMGEYEELKTEHQELKLDLKFSTFRNNEEHCSLVLFGYLAYFYNIIFIMLGNLKKEDQQYRELLKQERENSILHIKDLDEYLKIDFRQILKDCNSKDEVDPFDFIERDSIEKDLISSNFDSTMKQFANNSQAIDCSDIEFTNQFMYGVLGSVAASYFLVKKLSLSKLTLFNEEIEIALNYPSTCMRHIKQPIISQNEIDEFNDSLKSIEIDCESDLFCFIDKVVNLEKIPAPISS
ncbi:MAG: hypothetical protein COA79_22550 [Planctomycetota bacterium]|nr:MAG: hypothetical protein COA79_22550 [Planctomycetota bacterium]